MVAVAFTARLTLSHWLSDVITGKSLGSCLMDFVNRATESVDEAYELGTGDSRFEEIWPAMYCLENSMYSLVISNLENVKVCPARGTLKFRLHCLEPSDMGMVPPGERN